MTYFRDVVTLHTTQYSLSGPRTRRILHGVHTSITQRDTRCIRRVQASGLQWPGARALGGGGVESSAVGVALRDCSGEPSTSEPLDEPDPSAERIEAAVETCGEA